MSALYTIEISENQKTCIELALREFATAHPEIVKSDDFDLGSEHPTAIAGMLADCIFDATNCFAL